MLISKLKTEADFNIAPLPAVGQYLRWIKDNQDGTFTEYIKDHEGTVQQLVHATDANITLAKVTGTVTETTAVVRPFTIDEFGVAQWSGEEVTAYWKLEGPAS